MELDYVKLKQIKPAITGCIRKSQLLLNKSDIPDEKAIHDIRVQMKKTRAFLNLIAHKTDNPYYDRDIADLREVGRLLCCQRDTSVKRKILKELRKEFPDILDKLHDNKVLNLILEKQETSFEPGEEPEEVFGQIAVLLKKTGFRIRFQSMNMIDPQTLLKEIDITYKRVADMYLRCRNNPKPAAIHNFRKKAKDFLYQLYIFRPLNPSVIKVLEKKLDIMTQNLGKHNDLHQFVNDLGYNYLDNANVPAMNELILKIRDKQDRYLSKVWTPAYQIFCPGQNLVNLLGFKLLVI